MRGDCYSKPPGQNNPRKFKETEKENVAKKDRLCGRLKKNRNDYLEIKSIFLL